MSRVTGYVSTAHHSFGGRDATPDREAMLSRAGVNPDITFFKTKGSNETPGWFVGRPAYEPHRIVPSSSRCEVPIAGEAVALWHSHAQRASRNTGEDAEA